MTKGLLFWILLISGVALALSPNKMRFAVPLLLGAA